MPDGPPIPRFGDIRRFGTLSSTNEVLARLARQGAAEGTVVVADHQTAGRGRLGRRWEAPPGTSLLVSVLLRAPPASGHAHLTTLAMALAAADACAEVAGVRLRLKWPNDLVVENSKVGGVLGEATQEWAIVGLGLNVNWGEEPPPPPGVALDRLAGREVDREALLVALLRHLDQRLDIPPERLVDDYRANSSTLGRRVRIALSAGTVEGQAVDVTAGGHLVVDTGGRLRIVAAGDVVHLRSSG